MEILEWLFGTGPDLTAAQMCARAAVVFLLTLAALRISGRRSFGQHSAFDSVVAVLLGAITSRAVVGASEFVPAMAAGATIVLLHRFVGWIVIVVPRLDVLLNGRERPLVRHGRVDVRQMKKALITAQDLDEAARLHGLDRIDGVGLICLERNGEISFVNAPKDIDAEAAE